MNLQISSTAIVKHELLKKLYLLEEEFNIHSLSDCQNLIVLLNNFLTKDEIDEDIKYIIFNILDQAAKNLKNENMEDCVCCDHEDFQIDDNRKDLRYEDHSYAFKTFFSRRIFEAQHPEYSYNRF